MKKITALIISFIPLAVHAQDANLNGLIVAVGKIIDKLIPIAASLALLVFFFGIAKFMLAGGDEEKVRAGKQMLLWGVIALFVISALWGIIESLQRITGTGNDLDILPGSLT